MLYNFWWLWPLLFVSCPPGECKVPRALGKWNILNQAVDRGSFMREEVLRREGAWGTFQREFFCASIWGPAKFLIRNEFALFKEGNGASFTIEEGKALPSAFGHCFPDGKVARAGDKSDARRHSLREPAR